MFEFVYIVKSNPYKNRAPYKVLKQKEGAKNSSSVQNSAPYKVLKSEEGAKFYFTITRLRSCTHEILSYLYEKGSPNKLLKSQKCSMQTFFSFANILCTHFAITLERHAKVLISLKHTSNTHFLKKCNNICMIRRICFTVYLLHSFGALFLL